MHPARLVAFLVGAVSIVVTAVLVASPQDVPGTLIDCGSVLFPVPDDIGDPRCSSLLSGDTIIAFVVLAFAIACLIFGVAYRGRRVTPPLPRD